PPAAPDRAPRTAASPPAGEGSPARGGARESPAPSPGRLVRRERSTPAAGRQRRTDLTQAKATSDRRGTSDAIGRLGSPRALPSQVCAPHADERRGEQASQVGSVRRASAALVLHSIRFSHPTRPRQAKRD